MAGVGEAPDPAREASPSPTRALREWFGLLRSLVIYWRPGRQRGLRRLYGPFVDEGDLVFDIGAHLGDRVAAFAGLGATVVALEPHPRIFRWLRRLVGRKPGVILRNEAAGEAPGTGTLTMSRATPTVSTLADGWRESVGDANRSFRGVRWEDPVPVPMTTLDLLIEAYGPPSFCKIDVEGYEAEVLAGLSRPLAALSVEFVSGGLDVPRECVERLGALGDYEFNAVPGEDRSWWFADWLGEGAVEDWLDAGADGISSGDLYARLRSDAGAARRPYSGDDRG